MGSDEKKPPVAGMQINLRAIEIRQDFEQALLDVKAALVAMLVQASKAGQSGVMQSVKDFMQGPYAVLAAEVLAQMPATLRSPECAQCGGVGMWRPPYARELEVCDCCTSRPSSQASATTEASEAGALSSA